MLKRMVATVLASVGLLSLNANTTLAKPAVDFNYHKTYYPSTCSIAIEGEKYSCDYLVFGAFNNASMNMKFCSKQYCLILVVDASQVDRVANQQNFRVNRLAWQRGNSIVRQWDTTMRCGFSRTEGIGCVGELDNGNAIAVYTE
ncbi:hypothetical protein [Iningainema tapete]|uniref:Uncharacterized protein n=1 Tax=Iningainema tapete BLCC-T55 TaxID=2748662 RepID=A0A8J6XJY4_9CYAN|nr:hypothetical protein [Iningainema tapete]MBD2777459.1 hypothetical protein [Iningainema tapete BLCC-T55]